MVHMTLQHHTQDRSGVMDEQTMSSLTLSAWKALHELPRCMTHSAHHNPMRSKDQSQQKKA